LRHQLEAESERGRDDLAQMTYFQVHLRNLSPFGVAAGDVDHRFGYGELVQSR
jgi:hypothetical protein